VELFQTLPCHEEVTDTNVIGMSRDKKDESSVIFLRTLENNKKEFNLHE
jgi:hypothetical protein